ALLAEVVNRQDVGVLQAGDGVGLALEAVEEARFMEKIGRKHLDGDEPMQRGVERLVHDRHPAAADHLRDLIGAETLPFQSADTGRGWPRFHTSLLSSVVADTLRLQAHAMRRGSLSVRRAIRLASARSCEPRGTDNRCTPDTWASVLVSR